MNTNLAGASVWERDLYDHLIGHVDAESAVIARYEDAATRTSSDAFRYIARLIVEDERRHHRLIEDLAESLEHFVGLTDDPGPVPRLDPPEHRDDLVRLTEELLAIEQADRRDLQKLRKKLEVVGTTTLWQLVVDMMQRDTDKHIAILKFTRTWLRSA